MDTPIFDGVLGDRLAQAREAVQLAEHDSRAFTAALALGQAQALEQLAQTRAEALARERTAALTAQVAILDSELRRLRADAANRSEAVRPPTAAAPATPADPAAPATLAPAPDPAAPPAPAASPARVVLAPAAAAVSVAAVSVAAVHPAARGDGTVRAGRPATVRTGRLAADAGPTGDDVPSVPSMKDLFASTRAAGWLDQLLGARR